MKKNIFVLLTITFLYLFINFIFNSTIWKEVIVPHKKTSLVLYGESPTYEVVSEIVRKNIIAGKNPFTKYENIFYPQGWNFVLDDTAPFFGFIFLFTRPFLDMHQSLMLIVVTSIFLSNLSMFLLLKLLNFDNKTSFLGGLIYGFTPFISLRLGHPNYLSLYFFPLFTALIILIYKNKNKFNKLFFSICLGFLAWTLILTNLYYTVMIFLSLIIFGVIILIFEKKIFFNYFFKQIKYFILSFIVFTVLLIPWLAKVFEFLKFNSYNVITPIVNYIPYSADLLNLFIPSRANLTYQHLLLNLNHYLPYTKEIFEDFIYPGILVISGLLSALFFWKKLPKIIKMTYITSIIFLILAFGPYLKFFGKITKIPLPYLLLYKIPLIQMARAPGRFVIPFVFFAVIVSSYIFQKLTNKITNIKKIILTMILLLVFFIDQRYLVTPESDRQLPTKIYSYLFSKNPGPVLDIPYSIRDGLRFLGHKHLIWHPYAQLLHNQPIYGIYAGRIDEDIFEFYKNDPLFGLLDQIINSKPRFYKEKIKQIDLEKIKQSIEFFNIKTIILKHNQKYSKGIDSIITQIGFKKILIDQNYSLYQNQNTTFLSIGKYEMRYLDGWYSNELEGRWSKGKINKILFKNSNKKHLNLTLNIYSIKKYQSTSLYLNSQFIKKIEIKPDQLLTFQVDLTKNLKLGFNEIIFKSSNSYLLNQVTNIKEDFRNVSFFLKNIEVK
jgi:hypothetical protein